MANEPKPDAAATDGAAKPTGGNSIVPWIAVGVISAGLGSALPLMMAGQQQTASEDDEDSAAATDAKKEKKVKAFSLPKEEDTIFMPFGEPGKDQGIVVNLDEGKLTRYLRIAVTMQIPKSAEEDLKKQVEAKKIVLRNWLLSKISDLDLDDIRGAAGQNRLRREIRDQFNSVLCPDGYDQIYDVLFEEFNVQ